MDERSKLSAFTHRVGRRGAVLLILSAVFFIYGFSLATVDITEEQLASLRDGPFVLLVTILHPRAWGWTWMVASLLAAIQALGRASERGAFASLTFISMVWGLGSLAGFVLSGSTGRDSLTGLLWLAVSMLTIVIAGWGENPRRYRRNDPTNGSRKA